MIDRLDEFRNFATRCRKLAAESASPEARDRITKLAELLEQTAAETESDDVLLAALEEVVLSLPIQPEGNDLSTGVGEQRIIE